MTATMLLSYLVCHLVGVSSACTNPILYGLLNYNIQAEVTLLLERLRQLPRLLWRSQPPQSERIEIDRH